MREIKFRAWDKGLGMSTPFTLRWLAEAENGTDVKEFEIYMQYTGLKDKNGVEIYEGDIVEWSIWTWVYSTKTHTEEQGEEVRIRDVVVYSDKTAHFLLKNRAESVFKSPHQNLEVIGNIYKNEDLLNDNAA